MLSFSLHNSGINAQDNASHGNAMHPCKEKKEGAGALLGNRHRPATLSLRRPQARRGKLARLPSWGRQGRAGQSKVRVLRIFTSPLRVSQLGKRRNDMPMSTTY
jgi:hypothetical protein